MFIKNGQEVGEGISFEGEFGRLNLFALDTMVGVRVPYRTVEGSYVNYSKVSEEELHLLSFESRLDPEFADLNYGSSITREGIVSTTMELDFDESVDLASKKSRYDSYNSYPRKSLRGLDLSSMQSGKASMRNLETLDGVKLPKNAPNFYVVINDKKLQAQADRIIGTRPELIESRRESEEYRAERLKRRGY